MARSVATRQFADRGLLPRAKVLLVGADQASVAYYLDILEGLGLEVLRCTNYEAGLAHLKRETFGLVFVSQNGHPLAARPVLERVMQLDLRIPVLVMMRRFDIGECYEAMRLVRRRICGSLSPCSK
jgi:DNA-binding NtrC family response regulator